VLLKESARIQLAARSAGFEPRVLTTAEQVVPSVISPTPVKFVAYGTITEPSTVLVKGRTGSKIR
jgi:hypothetical protein